MTRESGRIDNLKLTARLNTMVFIAALLLTVGLGTLTHSTVCFGIVAAVLVIIQTRDAVVRLRGVSVERAHLPRSFEGADVQVDLKIHNPGRRSLTLVHITDSFPPSGAYRVRMLAPLVTPETRVTFRYTQRCARRRGFYVLGPVSMSMSDALGMCEVSRTCNELTDLVVYPVPVPLYRLPLVGRPTRVNIGEEIVRAFGRSEQFASLREYRRGDPARFVHWRTTARVGHPVIKEFDRNVVVDVTVFLDLRLVSLVGIGDSNSVELRIQAAASVAAQAIERHHRVRLVGVCDPPVWTTSGGGTHHLAVLLDWLAMAGAKGGGTFEERVQQGLRWCPAGSTAILLVGTAGLDLGRLQETVRLLSIRRVLPIVVIVEDRDYEKIRDEHVEAFGAAPDLSRLVPALRDAGAIVYTTARHAALRDRLALPS